jgi:hypothetical protein
MIEFGHALEYRGLITSYLLAKVAVLEAGFENEITWQEQLSLDDVDEQTFLREAAWVVLSSGMREAVIRRLFPTVEEAFGCWHSATWIVEHAKDCKAQALSVFAHERKIEGLVEISRVVVARGVESLIADVKRFGPDALKGLPYMGPATSRHLAKNLGVDVAKPDRHLIRVAEIAGYDSPARLCEHIAEGVGDTVAVVDLVIWRFATISTNYVEFFGRNYHQHHMCELKCCAQLLPCVVGRADSAVRMEA